MGDDRLPKMILLADVLAGGGSLPIRTVTWEGLIRADLKAINISDLSICKVKDGLWWRDICRKVTDDDVSLTCFEAKRGENARLAADALDSLTLKW